MSISLIEFNIQLKDNAHSLTTILTRSTHRFWKIAVAHEHRIGLGLIDNNTPYLKYYRVVNGNLNQIQNMDISVSDLGIRNGDRIFAQ
jgi:hypothetical protein